MYRIEHCLETKTFKKGKNSQSNYRETIDGEICSNMTELMFLLCEMLKQIKKKGTKTMVEHLNR